MNAQEPDFSKMKLDSKIESTEKLGDLGFYKIRTEYLTYVYDKKMDKIYDSGIDNDQLFIVEKEDNWQILFRENNMGETVWKEKGKIKK